MLNRALVKTSDYRAVRILVLLASIFAAACSGCANSTTEAVSEERAAADYRKFQRLIQEAKTEEAIEHGEKLLVLADRMDKGGKATRAVVLYHLGELYLSIGDYAASTSRLEDALAIIRKYEFAEILEEWTVILMLAKVYTLAGDLDRSDDLYGETLRIINGRNDISEAIRAGCLSNYAELCLVKGDLEQAGQLLNRALTIFHSDPDRDDVSLVAAQLRLAELYRLKARYQDALDLCAEAMETTSSAENVEQRVLANILGMKGKILSEVGQYDEAERVLQQCLTIQKQNLGGEHSDVAVTLAGLGTLAEASGDYIASERYFNRSITIAKTAFGDNHPTVAVILGNMAVLYRKMGDYEKAAILGRQSFEMNGAILGDEHAETAQQATELASMLREAGQFEEAEGMLLRAWEVVRKTCDPNSPREALVFGSLATLYVDMGKTEEAEKLYNRSLEIRASHFGTKDPEAVEGLNNLALLYLRKGDIEAAENMFDWALRVAERTLGDEHPKVAAVLNNIAAFEESRNKLDAAIDAADRARRIVRKNLPGVLCGLSLQEHIQFQEVSDHPSWDTALSIALAHPGNANAAKHSAGCVLNGKAMKSGLLAGRARFLSEAHDPTVAKKAREFAGLERTLATLVMRGPQTGQSRTYMSRLAALEQRKQQLSRELGYEMHHSHHQGGAWVSLESVQDALAKEAVLVEIVRVEPVSLRAKRGHQRLPSRFVAWVITDATSKPPKIVDLGEASLIESEIQDVRALLQKAHVDIEAEGEPKAEAKLRERIERLSNLVIAPLAKHLAGKSTWLVSPDGALWLVPWEMLILDGKYVIEDYAITYLISGRELLSRPDHRKPQVPVVVADPDYDAVADEPKGPEDLAVEIPSPFHRAEAIDWTKLRSVKWSRLPGTREEARRIIPMLSRYAKRQEVVALLGEDAGEREFKRHVTRPRVLVASTHGFFVPVAPRTGKDPPARAPGGDRGIGGILAEGRKSDTGVDAELYRILANNPLLQCGLVLAGANRKDSSEGPGEEDGILTGLEAASLDLTGTEVVILSACDTGVGEIHVGEGVASLRQSLLIAGADDVIATLWKVPDTETTDLVSSVVENLSGGQPIGKALRRAQLEMISKRRENRGAAHPLFWASFTRTGHWRYPNRFGYRKLRDGALLFEERWPDGSPKVRSEMESTTHGSLLEHGSFTRWHRNGRKKAEVQFVNGKQDGTWVKWHANGVKASEGNYSTGVRFGPFSHWNSEGKETAKGQYVDDELSGTITTWDKETGDRSVCEFVNGKPNGTAILFNEKGVKFCELQYKDGLEDGTATFWDDNGEKTSELEYSEGVIVESRPMKDQ